MAVSARDADTDPHADWPDRRELRDAAGAVVLVYSSSTSVPDGAPWADGVWLPPGVSAAAAAALALKEMPAWVFSTSDVALADLLAAAGAVERRHAHSMTCTLADVPRPVAVPGLRVEPLTAAQVDRHALRLGAVHLRAYPPGHPDAFERDEAAAVSQVRAMARGEILGPMTAESRIALYGGDVAAVCIVVDRPGEPPHGGPWVLDVFRDPDSPARGAGRAVLVDAMSAAKEAGLPGLSLVVSHTNAGARRLYGRLGFVDVDESRTLVLP